MSDVFFILIAVIYLAGSILRVYRQARFYQIEEYISGRYLRWLLMERTRWLPVRPVGVWFVGAALSAMLSEGGMLLPGILSAALSAVAVWPPREGEIKKPFRRTARAQRLLGAAFLITLIALMVGALAAAQFAGSVESLRFALAGLAGLTVYLLSPLALVAGNVLLTPLEEFLRRRYIQQARGVLAQVNPKVIGITGSYGKTTTKHFLADILNGRFKVYATPKSYNTLMGICLAINDDLKDDYSVEYFIVEMGAYIRGEIQRICELTPPQIAIVVEVGPQHLERFGSLENTALAKYEIVKALPPDGVGVFNWDNPYVRAMYERGYPATRIAVSRCVDPRNAPEGGPRFVASDIHESLNGLQFTVTDRQSGESQRFATPVLGEHNITNILLATAVAVHEGMPLRDVAFRVRRLQPAESRLTRQTMEGITVINDAYSANPAGVMSALKVLGMHTAGKRLLITPGMVELGDLMDSENRKLGEIAAQYATDVILVGEKRTQPIRDGLQDAGFPPERLCVVETLAEAVAWYRANLQPGDTVMFLNDLPDTY